MRGNLQGFLRLWCGPTIDWKVKTFYTYNNLEIRSKPVVVVGRREKVNGRREMTNQKQQKSLSTFYGCKKSSRSSENQKSFGKTL